MQPSMQRGSCQGLIYSVFQQPRLSQSGGTVVVLVAAHPMAGTTHLTTFLTESLNSDGDARSIAVDCRTLAQLSESSAKPFRVSETLPPAVPSKGKDNWRSSRDFRASYLNDLRARYNSVLIDCPSLKESMDITAIAPLVDGVLLIVEANKTTKSQIIFLERTIEAAGGKVLGHLLNKRTYPIPGWAYKTLESWGI